MVLCAHLFLALPVPSGLFHAGLCPRDRPLKKGLAIHIREATGSGALIRGAADRSSQSYSGRKPK
jgi:hypothetical protein